ncbi:hypothetical protein PoB_002511000 [Plakobranchus ocellatus]|uniref:Uncharacterized protein n=1 Tax=Plakobranchus ocellatus TaxID=259542 RepID=A0AAV3ZVG6_9GAST|nr:hypothetical protein PoB_002511000 [Plakobranchus ocellatus]
MILPSSTKHSSMVCHPFRWHKGRSNDTALFHHARDWGGVGGTVASESALRSAGTLLLSPITGALACWRARKPEITLLWTGYKPNPTSP